MSLTLITQPEQFILAGNPSEYRFTTDNLYAAQGDFHKFRLTVTDIPAPSKQLIFVWQDVYLLLTTSTTPNNSGYQIGVPTTLTPLVDWVNNTFIPALQGNYYLNRDFVITLQSSLGGTVIIELTARAKGTAFNITFSTDVGATLTGTSHLAGANQTLRPNFQTHVELYISRLTLSDFTRITATQTHSDDTSRFRLSPILSTDYYGSPLPDYGGLSLKNISAAIIMFYCAYAEAYGSPIAIQKLEESALRYALQGGWGKDYHAQNSFLSKLNAGQTILNHATTYRIGQSKQHFLNYLHWQNLTNFKVYTTITYTDNTSETLTLYIQASGATKPTLWCIPAGYNAIAAIKNPAKQVYSYEVWVGATANPATLYSQKVLQIVDYRPQIQETALLFKNGFGVYEVFRCTGTVAELAQPSRQNAQRLLPADYAVTDAQTVTFANADARQWQVNTGFKSKADMQVFATLLLSPSVYLIGSYFAPVAVQANEAALAASRSGRLNEATFTLMADAPINFGTHV